MRKRKTIRPDYTDRMLAAQMEELRQQAPPVRTTNHLLHIILSVMTGGLWLPIWLLVWLGGSVRSATVVLGLILLGLVWLL